MILVENLCKSFDGVKVLDGANLAIERGEIIALIGKSGHGKSVLLKHIAGMMRGDRGRIVIDGKDMQQLRSSDLRRLRARLGYMFQTGALFDSMNIYDNTAFPLREKTAMGEEEIHARVMGLLDQVGLDGAEQKYPAQLSGGMIKRAALARCLMTDPEIMLFDEPTTGLDPIIASGILSLIKACHAKFRFTGIVVTHQIPQVFDFVQKVAMLHDGKVWAYGPSDEIRNSKDPYVHQFITGSIEGPIAY